MRYAIYTILGLITLGMISTAVLSQELYRPTFNPGGGGTGVGPLCIGVGQVVGLSAFFGADSVVGSPEKLTVNWSGTKIEVQFTNGCATSAKVVQ